MTKLYIATCERCGSTVAAPEQPERCPYCAETQSRDRSAPRYLWRWFLVCAALGVLAGLMR